MSKLKKVSKEERERILSGLVCRKLDENDLPQIDRLLAAHYTAQHPLREIFRLTPEDIGDRDIVRARIKIKNNASFGIFVKATGELVACEVNSIHDKASAKNPPTDAEIGAGSPRYATAMRFARFMEGDLFADLNANKILMLSMGSVKTDYRGLGVFDMLLQMRDDYARSIDCDCIVGFSVSNFSQRIMEKSGYTVLREVAYSDYVDPLTGMKPDLKLSPIHNSAKLIYKHVLPVQKNPVSKL